VHGRTLALISASVTRRGPIWPGCRSLKHGTVDAIEPATFELNIDPRGAQAWRAGITRL
jgi:hypothetical protein